MPLLAVDSWSHSLVALVTIAAAAAGGYLLQVILFAILKQLSAHTQNRWDDILIARLRPPMRLLLPLLTLLLVWTSVQLGGGLARLLRHVNSLLLIMSLGWLLVQTTRGLRDAFLLRYDLNARDNLKARAIHTQVDILVKIVVAVVILITTASILMTFEQVRQVGVSLLASAGIAGVIIGFAAQKTLGTIFAGIQIAITQPIRIDDVVIVEGEWGRIEEIALTYVVVRIWDERRLVLPITYFIDKPFQNWTRVSADILGTVYLYLDYRVPFEAVRAKLHEVLEAAPTWDRRVWNLQVVDMTDRVVVVRALMSAADASQAWELRCLVREKLVAWLQETYPEILPVVRARIDGAPPGAAAPD